MIETNAKTEVVQGTPAKSSRTRVGREVDESPVKLSFKSEAAQELTRRKNLAKKLAKRVVKTLTPGEI